MACTPHGRFNLALFAYTGCTVATTVLNRLRERAVRTRDESISAIPALADRIAKERQIDLNADRPDRPTLLPRELISDREDYAGRCSRQPRPLRKARSQTFLHNQPCVPGCQTGS